MEKPEVRFTATENPTKLIACAGVLHEAPHETRVHVIHRLRWLKGGVQAHVRKARIARFTILAATPRRARSEGPSSRALKPSISSRSRASIRGPVPYRNLVR